MMRSGAPAEGNERWVISLPRHEETTVKASVPKRARAAALAQAINRGSMALSWTWPQAEPATRAARATTPAEIPRSQWRNVGGGTANGDCWAGTGLPPHACLPGRTAAAIADSCDEGSSLEGIRCLGR